jgi:hypothetical protein
LINLQALFWGFFIGIQFDTVDEAIAEVPMVAILNFLVAGFVLNTKSLPIYAMPFHYIAVHTYVFNGLVKNQFEFWEVSECGIAPPCDVLDFLNIDM